MAPQDSENAMTTSVEANSNQVIGDGFQVNGVVYGSISVVNQKFKEPESDDALCLRDLYISNPWLDKQRIEDAKGGLLKDSYRWILTNASFQWWFDDPSARLLWINGSSGTGKTMLLCGVIEELRSRIECSEDRLCFFFCESANKNADSAAAVLRGLIFLLVDQQPDLIKHIAQEYKAAGSKLFEGAGAWYTLRGIFLGLLPHLQPGVTYFAIDAPEETSEPRDLERLLSLVSESSNTPHAHIKWLVTTGRRADVARRLEVGRPGREGLNLDDCTEELKSAVNAYIVWHAKILARPAIGDGILLQKIEQGLQEKSGTEFKYVALMVAKLGAVATHQMLDVLREAAPDLSGLFRQASDRINSLDRETKHLCRSVLATVALAHRPLIREELYALTGLESTSAAGEVLQKCSSFGIQGCGTFSVDLPAREFLCQDKVLFPAGLEGEHQHIFLRSLNLMERTLRRDMYRLKEPGFLAVDVKVPEPNPLLTSAYSCEYWIDHLVASRYNGREIRDDGALYAFLGFKYLHWIESLSLLGAMRTALSSWSKLVDFLQRKKEASRLLELVLDGQRFLEYNGNSIMARPLQAYASATLFVPSQSMSAELVWNQRPEWVEISDGMREEHWSPWAQMLDPGNAEFQIVGPVAFSSDGTWLAAALEATCEGVAKRVVQIWDAVQGNRVWEPLQNSGGWIAFPPNSTLLATAAGPWPRSGGIRFWNLASGAWHDSATTISPLDFSAAVFSPDGVWLAAADSNQISIWDWARGDCTLRFSHGSGSAPSSLAYSADGCRLASAHQGEIRVWNAASGSEIRRLDDSEASLIVFSPESTGGAKLISANTNSLVSWSVETGDRLSVLDLPSDPYSPIALSPDGRRFAAAPRGNIMTWDTVTRRRLQTLQGYEPRVRSLVFPPGGGHLASIGDRGLRLYRAVSSQEGDVLRAARDHPDNINILRVSNHGCGRTVVSASAKTIKVWHLDGARRPVDIKPAKGGILDVALSADGTQIVFASRLENAGVWSAQTGECLQAIPDTGFAVAFSPSGTRIAMLTSSRTLRLWDLTRRRFIRTPDQPRTAMQSGQFGVGAVTFASESRLAASQDRTIFIWNQKRLYWGQSLADDDTAKSLLFSSDNRRLASSYDDKIKIWDVAGSCCLQILNTAAIPHHLNLVAFDTAWSQLLTEVGIVDLGDPIEPSAEAGGTDREFRCQGYGVHAGIDGGWVTWNSRKVLWLPPAYYPDRSAVILSEPGASTPSAIVLGCRSGRVVVLQVNQDHLPR